MIHYYPEQHACLVPFEDVRHVALNQLPRYKAINHEGRQFIAVGDDLTTCRTLAAAGVDIQSGITRDYGWSGPYTPFDHQRVTADFMVKHPRGFVLNDIGSGKTLASLWAIDHLRTTGAIGKVLISCPMSVMESVWADALFLHFPHLKWVILHGTKKRRLQLLKSDADIFIINHAGCKVIADELKADRSITTVLIDELAVMRNWSSDTTRVHEVIAGIKSRRGCWGLTGSPTPRAPTDAWSQAKIVNPRVVSRYFRTFRELVMTQSQHNKFSWFPKPNWEQTVFTMLQPSIRFRRDECLDLPPCTTIHKNCEMSKQQAAAYAELKSECRVELSDGLITAANEAVKLNKFLQISAGYIYDVEKVAHPLDCKPKLKLLLESIEEAGGKAVVFTRYRSTIEPLKRVLEQAKYRVALIYSDVKPAARAAIFRNFQAEDSDIDVLLSISSCIQYGVNLTASSTIINWTAEDDFDVYNQGSGRITRPGQTKPQTIVNLVSSPAEQKVFARLSTKERMQGILLELLEN